MDWLRLWHDMPNDPKWRTIARKSGQRIGDIIGVYTHLMVIASSNKDRGSLGDFEQEDIASALNMEVEEVDAILKSMEGRVISAGRLSGWESRQPKREDGAESSRGKPSDNYVYFVATTDSDVVKIGISKNPWARLSDLQVANATKCSVLATIKTPHRSESEIHKFFAETRKKGEWFSRSDALNALISNIKEKSITQYDECIDFLLSLEKTSFLELRSSVVATKEEIRLEEIREEKNTQTAPITKAEGVCVFLKAKGIAAATTGHPELKALVAAGADEALFAAAATTATKAGKPEFAYVLGIVKNQMTRAGALASTPLAVPAAPASVAITMPGRAGPDPVLAKLDADALVVRAGPSAEVRAAMARLTSRPVATQPTNRVTA